MRKSLLFYLLFVYTFTSFAQLNEKIGIGVRLSNDSTKYKTTFVLAVIPNSPAEAAGLKAGDFILKVDDKITKGMLLDDVVKMIVGEEGTQVKLLVERNAVSKVYTIVRKKYKYANSYYQSAVNDNGFCSALAILMNDAPYDFNSTLDTSKRIDEKGGFGRTYYASKIKVPGAEKVTMYKSFGASCIITLGNFSTREKATASGDAILTSIKTCFPDYYYHSAGENGNINIQIGKKYDNGFESSILELMSYYSESEKMYTLIIRVNGGSPTRYYETKTAKEAGNFATALRTIYNDIPDFNNVKGTQHQETGNPLMGSWYEIKPKPDGAIECRLLKGGLSFENGCNCSFYVGENREEASKTFNKVYKLIRDALGSEFISSLEANKMDMKIPKNAEWVAVFGAKKKRTYESLPLMTLVTYKNYQNKYEVRLLFYKFGF